MGNAAEWMRENCRFAAGEDQRQQPMMQVHPDRAGYQKGPQQVGRPVKNKQDMMNELNKHRFPPNLFRQPYVQRLLNLKDFDNFIGDAGMARLWKPQIQGGPSGMDRMPIIVDNPNVKGQQAVKPITEKQVFKRPTGGDVTVHGKPNPMEPRPHPDQVAPLVEPQQQQQKASNWYEGFKTARIEDEHYDFARGEQKAKTMTDESLAWTIKDLKETIRIQEDGAKQGMHVPKLGYYHDELYTLLTELKSRQKTPKQQTPKPLPFTQNKPPQGASTETPRETPLAHDDLQGEGRVTSLGT